MLSELLENVGYAFDTPGAYLRGVLSGRGLERTSGEEMLKNWGVDAGATGGFLAEMLADPTNFLPIGGILKAVGLAAGGVAGAVGAYKLANKLDDAVRVMKGAKGMRRGMVRVPGKPVYGELIEEIARKGSPLDPSGNPLNLYHAAPSHFDDFDLQKFMSGVGDDLLDEGPKRIFLTDKPWVSSAYHNLNPNPLGSNTRIHHVLGEVLDDNLISPQKATEILSHYGVPKAQLRAEELASALNERLVSRGHKGLDKLSTYDLQKLITDEIGKWRTAEDIWDLEHIYANVPGVSGIVRRGREVAASPSQVDLLMELGMPKSGVSYGPTRSRWLIGRGSKQYEIFDPSNIIPANISENEAMRVLSRLKGMRAGQAGERTIAEVAGKTLSESEQQANKMKWFGNSKVVDEAGEPLKVYHATASPDEFSSFKPGGSNPKISGPAMWFTDDPARIPAAHNTKNMTATGTRVIPANLKIENPLQLDTPETFEWAREIYGNGSSEFPHILNSRQVKAIKQDGYDGIIFDRWAATGRPAIDKGIIPREFITFEPTQIKSIFNRGTWSPTDPNIMHGLAGAGLGGGLLAAMLASDRESNNG